MTAGRTLHGLAFALTSATHRKPRLPVLSAALSEREQRDAHQHRVVLACPALIAPAPQNRSVRVALLGAAVAASTSSALKSSTHSQTSRAGRSAVVVRFRAHLRQRRVAGRAVPAQDALRATPGFGARIAARRVGRGGVLPLLPRRQARPSASQYAAAANQLTRVTGLSSRAPRAGRAVAPPVREVSRRRRMRAARGRAAIADARARRRELAARSPASLRIRNGATSPARGCGDPEHAREACRPGHLRRSRPRRECRPRTGSRQPMAPSQMRITAASAGRGSVRRAAGACRGRPAARAPSSSSSIWMRPPGLPQLLST